MLAEQNMNSAAPVDAKPAWYCIRTKPKHEHIASANVARLGEVEVFCPRLRVQRATRRGMVRTREALFPCYLFVRCVIENRIDALRYANGVGSLVNFGGKIAQVPAGVVAELQNHFQSEDGVEVQDELQPGAEVVVSGGAFEGMQASVLQVLPARQRVQVLLEILGRPTRVEVERSVLSIERECMADRVPFLAAAWVPGEQISSVRV